MSFATEMLVTVLIGGLVAAGAFYLLLQLGFFEEEPALAAILIIREFASVWAGFRRDVSVAFGATLGSYVQAVEAANETILRSTVTLLELSGPVMESGALSRLPLRERAVQESMTRVLDEIQLRLSARTLVRGGFYTQAELNPGLAKQEAATRTETAKGWGGLMPMPESPGNDWEFRGVLAYAKSN